MEENLERERNNCELDYGDSFMGVYICQTDRTVQFTYVHFTVVQSYLS